MPKDYYDILGLEKNADAQQIKQSYREKAKLIHPDVNKDDDAEHQFQTLNKAYMVLSNPEERMQYNKGRELPIYTHEQVIEILRQRDHNNEFESIFRYSSRNVYPETNYKANLSAVQSIHVLILLIGILFITDLSLKRPALTAKVFEVDELFNYTRDVNDIGKKQVMASDFSFQLPAQSPLVVKGDSFNFQRSLVFGKLAIVKAGSNKAFQVIIQRPFTIGMTIIVLLIALLGLSPILNPERKFNAAIIGGFLCLPLFISLFLT
ncbi:MAG: hypothetical protein ACJAVN_000182 [Roseivirga sp.]|jgi:hypothetical protein